MPRTTTEKIKGAASVKTEKLHGTVVYVEGNRLVVKMSTGDLRTFEPPDDRRFIIDGVETRVGDLKPGTKLSATLTTTTTPVTERTTTVGTGKVWYVAGNTVILTLPNNENRMYKVDSNYRFNVEGNKKATVFELRKGMVVSAEKIVESPKTEIASTLRWLESAPPPPRTEVAAAAPAPDRPSPAPRPAPAAAPAPKPAAPAATAEAAPAELPHAGSPIHLFGTCRYVECRRLVCLAVHSTPFLTGTPEQRPLP